MTRQAAQQWLQELCDSRRQTVYRRFETMVTFGAALLVRLGIVVTFVQLTVAVSGSPLLHA